VIGSATSEEPFGFDAWLEAFRVVANSYGLPLSLERARLAERWQNDRSETARIRTLARGAGLQVRFAEPAKMHPTSWQLPLVAEMDSGQIGVVTAISADGMAAVAIVGEDGLKQRLPVAALEASARRYVIPRPAQAIPDARVDTYIRPYQEHWLRRILLQDVRSYGSVVIASFVTNLLALAGVLFSMQVYDRVVPAQSFSTLYVLFIGVVLAIGFSVLIGHMRTTIIDVLGRRADLRLSDRVFGHAMRVRNRDRPTSTGTFAAQLRDLEQVREMLTSTTVSALSDLPFFVLFLGVFWLIAGPLVMVPLGALVLMVAPGLLAQRRIKANASAAMREASLRNAMLVEAVQRGDDIKLLQAEDRFQQRWNHLNAATSEAQLKLRGLTGGLTVWTRNVQNACYATIVFFGAPMVMEGDLTTGALVGASILGSRMMGPVSHLSQVVNRWQQARVAVAGIDRLMALPVDNAPGEHCLHAPAITGDYELAAAQFRYGDENSAPALSVASLQIRAGEKVGILGRNGAGKSTLLYALSGMLAPSSGEVLLDNLALDQIDPADVRRDIGFLSQNSRLFHGTLRENLMLGAPHASDQDLMDALALVGADEFVRRSRAGLEQVVQEGGIGLSGGQTQSLLLARILVRQPSVLLLDEPTASMDDQTERQFIERFAAWGRTRTVIVATHRTRVLELVDRLIVVHGGTIRLDQAKDRALRTMRGEGKAA
jgi:ATP-binding cassette, subfamily C, bacterial LapB